MSRRHTAYGTGRVSRRDLLRIGTLAGLGLDLAGLFRTQAAKAPTTRVRSCILVFCNGGPSHIDTFDMKPEAPAELRGEFRSIATSVPGRRLRAFARTARLMHRLAVIRSMHHRMRGHRSGVTNALTGLPPTLGDVCTIPPDSMLLPSYAARLTYLTRKGPLALPHVALPYTMRDSGVVLPGQSAGFLGSAYERFQVEGDPSAPDFGLASLRLLADITLGRLENREALLRSIDAQREGLLERGPGLRVDSYHQQAVRLLTSSVVPRAFDLAQEPAKTREIYGRNIVGQSLLLARRLVEAGVRLVNVNVGDQQNEWYWDDHKGVFPGHKKKLAPFDRGFAALVEDLHDRGLLDSTLVISVGRIRPDAEDQPGRRPRPLAGLLLRRAGRRRCARRPGLWGQRQGSARTPPPTR